MHTCIYIYVYIYIYIHICMICIHFCIYTDVTVPLIHSSQGGVSEERSPGPEEKGDGMFEGKQTERNVTEPDYTREIEEENKDIYAFGKEGNIQNFI
jgi:hypothetical protein